MALKSKRCDIWQQINYYWAKLNEGGTLEYPFFPMAKKKRIKVEAWASVFFFKGWRLIFKIPKVYEDLW